MNVEITNPDKNSALVDIMAKENNAKDIAHMERVVSYMKENFGYVEMAGDGDYNVMIGGNGDNVVQAKKAYSEAKKATR